jgi:hypothetical protein
LKPSTHVPFAQALSTQSSTFVSQLAPVKPGAQLHVYPPVAFVHVPLLWHGWEAQLSIRFSQLAPS